LELTYHYNNPRHGSFRKGPVRCKIIVDNKYLQRSKNLNYLAYEISCENEEETKKKQQHLLKYWEF
jgi:hypothetical protein